MEDVRCKMENGKWKMEKFSINVRLSLSKTSRSFNMEVLRQAQDDSVKDIKLKMTSKK